MCKKIQEVGAIDTMNRGFKSVVGTAFNKSLGDTDCRYYYYLGLVLKHKGLTAEAKENFEYSLKLNPEFELSKKELNI